MRLRREREMVDVSTEANNRGAFLLQEHYCRQMVVPPYADPCAALAVGLPRDSRTGPRRLDCRTEPTRHEVPIRLMGFGTAWCGERLLMYCEIMGVAGSYY